jgi:hypothetical protein
MTGLQAGDLRRRVFSNEHSALDQAGDITDETDLRASDAGETDAIRLPPSQIRACGCAALGCSQELPALRRARDPG